MNSKTIYYDAFTFRFIRSQERRRVQLRNKLRRIAMFRSAKRWMRQAVGYAFIDLVAEK